MGFPCAASKLCTGISERHSLFHTPRFSHSGSEVANGLRVCQCYSKALCHLAICNAAAAREALVAQSKAHLELLEGQRKLYLRSRALTLAQRGLLYAHDELDMSTMRMQLRSPSEVVKPHEQHFRLQPFEVPLKNRVGGLTPKQQPR